MGSAAMLPRETFLESTEVDFMALLDGKTSATDQAAENHD
jgi:hypothetical protein